MTHALSNEREGNSDAFVSVILPAYNVARFIAEAVESVFAQTFTNYEVIVINYGAPDSEEIERALDPYMEQIVYVKQEDKGISAASNAALKIARGNYVAFLDADDLFLPTHLSDQLALIQSGSYDLVYADASTFGELDCPFQTVMQGNPSDGEVNFISLIEGRCTVINTTVVARLEPILQVGLFDENIRSSHDLDLWLRLAKRDGARMTYQRKILAKHRIYEEGLAADDLRSLEEEVRVLTKTSQRTDLTTLEQAAISRTLPQRKALVELWRGKERLRDGDFKGAIQSFSESHRLAPNKKLRMTNLSLRIAPRLFRRVFGARLV